MWDESDILLTMHYAIMGKIYIRWIMGQIYILSIMWPF